MAGAVLYVLANYWHFHTNYPSIVDELLSRCGGASSNTTWQQQAQAIRDAIHDRLRQDVRRVGRVGTSLPFHTGDFDMALHGLAHLLYLFIGDPVSLPSDVVYLILCMGGECTNPPSDSQSWAGQGGYFTFDIDRAGTVGTVEGPRDFFSVLTDGGGARSETENHVLSLYLWNYLATNYVLRRGQISDPNDPRYHKDIRHWYLTYGPQVESDPAAFYDPMLQILGRVMHNGFFENNARPYQKFTLSGILTAAIYGSPGGLPDVVLDEVEKVRQAARNAFGYAAASFALQALRGKRSTSFRRRLDYKTNLDFYKSNLGPVLFGLMSGAREWNACSDVHPKCRQLSYIDVLKHSWVLWPSMARHNARLKNLLDVGYELPEPILGLMFDPGPFYSRLQTRYTRGHYHVSAASDPYFDNESESFLPSDRGWRSTPELFFRTGDVMLAAGGQWQRYYDGTDQWSVVYNVIARPTMLFGRGDFGHPFDADTFGDTEAGGWLWRGSEEHAMEDALQNVLLIPGKRADYWESTCNVWVYRNFVYGYRYHDVPHEAPGEWYTGFPQRVPDSWSEVNPATGQPRLAEEFSIQSSRDRFRIYELEPGHLGEGTGKYYVVMARVYKEAATDGNRRHREYRRGFVEVVPGHLFGSAEALKAELLRWNRPELDYLPTEHLVDVPIPYTDRAYNYRYVLASSKERVTLSPEMGSDPGGDEGCHGGILRVEQPRVLADIPALSGNDWYWTERDLEDEHLPRDYSDDEHRRDLPLITAWELNGRAQPTGRRLVEVASHEAGDARHAKGAPRQGHLLIRRPVWTEFHAASTDLTYRRLTWQCLELDSHVYNEPTESYTPMAASYEDCLLGRPFELSNVGVAAGGRHTCALKIDGSVWCWGDNLTGQLGAALPGDRSLSPVQVVTRPQANLDIPLQDITAIAAGGDHTCALRQDGTLWCWGSNWSGQLGLPTGTLRSDTPRLVVDPNASEPAPMTGVVQVATGEGHTCVVRLEGGARRVLCWGENGSGQLGDGSQQSRHEPAPVLGLPEVSQISAGFAHTCAVDLDGGVWCWGRNQYGQLGDGSTTTQTTPVQVLGLEGPGTPAFERIVKVSAGRGHTCAIKHEGQRPPEGPSPAYDNSLWCWGWNAYGQLGDGTRVDRLRATRIPSSTGGSDPFDVSTGTAHSCAVLASGELLCWGLNHYGQLGDGTLSLRTAPTPVPGIAPRTVTSGHHHGCAVDGSDVWCWGWNREGQLGTGDTQSRLTPVRTIWQ